jgi:hypothetical protein
LMPDLIMKMPREQQIFTVSLAHSVCQQIITPCPFLVYLPSTHLPITCWP